MAKAIGALVLVLPAPLAMAAATTPIPDEWAAFAIITPFAERLLIAFTKGKGR